MTKKYTTGLVIGIPASLDKSKAGSVRGMGGKQSSNGTAMISTLFYNLQIFADVEFRLIEDDTVATLLSLSDMNSNRNRHEYTT